jgi:hypothetical protein
VGTCLSLSKISARPVNPPEAFLWSYIAESGYEGPLSCFLVNFSSVLSHMQDITGVLTKFARVLSSGSECLLSDIRPQHPYTQYTENCCMTAGTVDKHSRLRLTIGTRCHGAKYCIRRMTPPLYGGPPGVPGVYATCETRDVFAVRCKMGADCPCRRWYPFLEAVASICRRHRRRVELLSWPEPEQDTYVRWRKTLCQKF